MKPTTQPTPSRPRHTRPRFYVTFETDRITLNRRTGRHLTCLAYVEDRDTGSAVKFFDMDVHGPQYRQKARRYAGRRNKGKGGAR